jgi:hypothetical protein
LALLLLLTVALLASEGRDLLRSSLKTVVTSQPQNSDKVVIEMVVDNNATIESDSWPFEHLCAIFCNELFEYVCRHVHVRLPIQCHCTILTRSVSPAWEIRHGAAIGLREVLRNHARGAGRTGMSTKIDAATIGLICN